MNVCQKTSTQVNTLYQIIDIKTNTNTCPSIFACCYARQGKQYSFADKRRQAMRHLDEKRRVRQPVRQPCHWFGTPSGCSSGDGCNFEHSEKVASTNAKQAAKGKSKGKGGDSKFRCPFPARCPAASRSGFADAGE